MHWRETMRPPRFFIVDGRAAIFLLLAGVYPAWWVFLLVFAIFGFLIWNERQGLTVPSAVRLVRYRLAGLVQYLNPKIWFSRGDPRDLIPRRWRPTVTRDRRRRWIDSVHGYRAREAQELLRSDITKISDKKPARSGTKPAGKRGVVTAANVSEKSLATQAGRRGQT